MFVSKSGAPAHAADDAVDRCSHGGAQPASSVHRASDDGLPVRPRPSPDSIPAPLSVRRRSQSLPPISGGSVSRDTESENEGASGLDTITLTPRTQLTPWVQALVRAMAAQQDQAVPEPERRAPLVDGLIARALKAGLELTVDDAHGLLDRTSNLWPVGSPASAVEGRLVRFNPPAMRSIEHDAPSAEASRPSTPVVRIEPPLEGRWSPARSPADDASPGSPPIAESDHSRQVGASLGRGVQPHLIVRDLQAQLGVVPMAALLSRYGLTEREQTQAFWLAGLPIGEIMRPLRQRSSLPSAIALMAELADMEDIIEALSVPTGDFAPENARFWVEAALAPPPSISRRP